MNEVSMRVSEDLDFDMLGASDELLKIYLIVAKCSLCFSTCGNNSCDEVCFLMYGPPAATTTASACLHHQRIPDFSC